MNIIIYNPNSKGGNYKYAQHTALALAEQGQKVTLILPKNIDKTQILNPKSDNQSATTYNLKPTTYILHPILLSDQPQTNNTLFKKLHFFIRIFFNPIIFYFFLIKQKDSKVIFNDFDQLTAIFWVPLFKHLRKKHHFSIILHDPDRDAYPGGIKHTNRSMKAIMNLMDVAFFHEKLPIKPYYQSYTGNKKSIPHGIYTPAPADNNLINKILSFKGDAPLLCIPGNIRYEKNYHLIIEALKELPKCKLLIAGAPSSSGVNIEELKTLAVNNQVDNRILWITQYLSENEFTSILNCSDLILLYYKQSFTSQSGILNQIAPLSKNVLISDTSSALSKLAKEYKLGTVIEADCKESFIAGVKIALNDSDYSKQWKEYINYASWEKQAKQIIRSIGD